MSNHASARSISRNVGLTLLIFVVGVLAVYGFELIGTPTEIGFPVFILGILILSLESDSGLWGALLGVLYLLAYDCLFTEPVFELKILNMTDIVALVIFLLVALIMSTLTRRMRQQVVMAERNALVTKRLNKVSTGLIDSGSADSACRYAETELQKALGRDVKIVLGEPGPDQPEKMRECFENGYATGAGEPGGSKSTRLYLPIATKSKVYGVGAIDSSEGILDATSRSFVESVLSQTAIAIERNLLAVKAQEDQAQIENARFRNELLTSVSQDLHAPVERILSSVESLKSDPDLDESRKEELLASISKDAHALAATADGLSALVDDGDDNR